MALGELEDGGDFLERQRSTSSNSWTQGLGTQLGGVGIWSLNIIQVLLLETVEYGKKRIKLGDWVSVLAPPRRASVMLCYLYLLHFYFFICKMGPGIPKLTILRITCGVGRERLS